MQMHEKVGRSRNTIFLHWFEAPEGRNVGSLKRRLRSHLARWEMRNWTPLWREAHFEVKMYKTHQVRTTFGSCDVGKSARRCGVKHISKSKCAKHTMLGPLCKLRCRKVYAIVAPSKFRSQNVQNTTCSRHFWTFRCRFVWQAQGIVHLLKVSKKVRVLWHVQKRWQAWDIFEEDLQRCIFRGRRSTRDIFIGTGGEGADFLRGVAFWSIRCAGLLRWFSVTGAALRMTWHHFFMAGPVLSTGGLQKSQNAMVRGCQLCTQLSIFEGSLAELLRFGCCPVQKMKKSHRIASFFLLSTSKNEDVSQNSFVFKLADRQIDIGRQTDRQR